MAVGNYNVNLRIGGFLPLLCLVFVAAKLFGAIAWSWWWVTAPLWGPFALVFGGGGILLGLAGLVWLALWLYQQATK
jgi:hypothetical protein